MNTPRKRVLITGAGGKIGMELAQRLRNRYELRLHYRHPPATWPNAEVVTGELTDFSAMRQAVDGVDAIVHLAADPRTTAPWESVLSSNIIGTYHVFEAARQAGVSKIVFASSNHAMGMYDRDHQWPIYSFLPPRPDSLYGVSKVFGEALGRYYADRFGISVICLRIGSFLPAPTDEVTRWMWISPRDCAQLVWRAIESDLLFGIFYGVSGNSGRHWDITDAMEQLGYRPEDDAERFFAETSSGSVT